MQSFSKNKFIATILTVSFVGTSLFAPFTVSAEKQDIGDIFSDPKMQRDAVRIVASCIMIVYKDDAIKLLSSVTTGISDAFASDEKSKTDKEPESTEAKSKAQTADTQAKTAKTSAESTAASSVPIVSVPVAEALDAISIGLSAIKASTVADTKTTTGNDAKKGANDSLGDCLMYGAGQLLLKQLTNNIVTWVKGGFHGSPSFAVDTHEVFLDLADMVAGDLAREIRGISMCKFSATFQNDLANNIELSAKHIYKFQGATKCPFPETINVNSSDFYKQANNFTWAGMEYAMTDAGNPFGVALLSGRELSLRSSEKAEVRKQELSWSNGFTNMVDTDNCDYPDGYTTETLETDGKVETFILYDRESDPSAYGPNQETRSGVYLSPKETQNLQKTYCKTTTPGKIVGDQLTKALGVDADRLGLVDSLNKIIAAVIERLTQDASMGIFKAVSGQSEAKVQQNYITTQDKTAETIFMENYAIKSAKDELATAQGNLDIALKDMAVPQETIFALRQMVSDAQKRVDDIASPERAIARQTELNTAHTEVDSALSSERSAQASADSASTAYYTALNGTLDGGTYIQPDPATLANLKAQWDNADNALVKAQGVTANARQRLYDAQHP